jgi:hypothetical protein
MRLRQRSRHVADLLVIASVLGFFALSCAYAVACDRI